MAGVETAAALTRRGALLGAAGLAACAMGPTYADLAGEVWAPLALDRVDLESELIRAATLAANSHNTQPWLFERAWPRIVLRPDETRRTPVVDPDDRHLWASLGCAAENLVIAARAAGFEPAFEPPTAARREIRLDLGLTRPAEAGLAPAITQRRSVRLPFDGKPLSREHRAALDRAAASDRVALVAIDDAARMATLRDYVIDGAAAQTADPAFMRELRDWIRFDKASAARHRDGLYAGAAGAPGAMDVPDWIGRSLMPQVLTVRSETERVRAQLDSTPFAAVLVAAADDLTHWFEAGRVAQRLTLQAAALGLKSSWINQPVEVSAVRGQFAAWLGLGARQPHLVLRFGAGPEAPRSLRRPVEAVTASPR